MAISWKNMNWLAVAGAFTVAYGVAIELTLGWHRTIEFLTGATALNEVGDFLAGVFAPIALIWLVAAVLTQRQELNETRSQFEENQKVVDAQLKTINSQNGLLALQHNQAVENAKKAYRLSLFDKRLSLYQRLVAFEEEHNDKDFDINSYWQMVNLAHEAAFIFDHELHEWLGDISMKIGEYIEFVGRNPLKDIVRGHEGTQRDMDYNETIKKETQDRSWWITEQLLPETRNEKFWKFMHVSDEPYMGG